MAIGTISNKTFAEAAGVSPSMASRLLNGQRLPGLDVIQNIARHYGVPLDSVVAARNSGQAGCGKFLRALVKAHIPA